MIAGKYTYTGKERDIGDNKQSTVLHQSPRPFCFIGKFDKLSEQSVVPDDIKLVLHLFYNLVEMDLNT